METKSQILTKIVLIEEEIKGFEAILDLIIKEKEKLQTTHKNNVSTIKRFKFILNLGVKESFKDPVKLKFTFWNLAENNWRYDEKEVSIISKSQFESLKKQLGKECYIFEKTIEMLENEEKTFLERIKSLKITLNKYEKDLIEFKEKDIFVDVDKYGNPFDSLGNTPQKAVSKVIKPPLKNPGNSELNKPLRTIAKRLELVKGETVPPEKIPVIMEILKKEFGIISKSKDSVKGVLRREGYVKTRI